MSINVEAEFTKHGATFLDFDDLVNKRSNCTEIHAFLLLNELVPTDRMICSAEHDQIWLDTNIEELAKVATSEHIEELVRCGVFYDSGIDCLSMNR